jgi:multimeric flavodoxin WrbA
MKVLGINGSPNKKGNTAKQLSVMAEALKAEGIEMEIVHIGNKVIRGCMACNQCVKKQNMGCIFKDDPVNEILAKAKEADGIVIGAAVHFAGVNGTMKSFLDRFAYVALANNNALKNKVGAAVVSVRRTGGSTTYSELQRYFPILSMYTVGSTYWPVGHGVGKYDVHGDTEGIITMKNQAAEMAYLIKAQKAAQKEGIELTITPSVYTNFSRADLYDKQ